MAHESKDFLQMFDLYYVKAKEAEAAGKNREAKKLYLLAGEEMLKAAKASSGETREKYMHRADKLRQIADSIQEEQVKRWEADPPRQPKEPESLPGDAVWRVCEKPKVSFDDIIGLEEAKEAVRHRVVLPRLYPEIYEEFHREVSGGILLYGPPGTGKTMLAKAIACEVDAEFFVAKGSSLLDRYVGGTEGNIKKLFQAAHACGRAIIFIDEFDAVGKKRGGDSDARNSAVSELLTEMDGFASKSGADILVLGGTNRPWDIDSAFLRPPRLTEKIYVGLPGYGARAALAEKQLAGIPRAEDVRLEEIAQAAEGFNCADIVYFCNVLKDSVIDRKIRSGGAERITRADIELARKKVHTSVQREDVEHIRQWEQSQGR